MDRSKRIAIQRESISKIAKILTADKVSVTQSGVKAFVKYDEKTLKPLRVNLPMLPDDASDELIDAVQGFLDGEISRVLFADSESALKSQYGQLDGIYKPIESLFCEKKMIQDYPGSRHNLNNMHQEFVDRFIEPKLKEAQANGADEVTLFQVLAVPALRAWGGIQFFKDYMSDKWSLIAGIQKQLDPIASKMSGMTDPKECYEMAKNIRNLVMGEPPEGDGENPFGDNSKNGGGAGGSGGKGGKGGKGSKGKGSSKGNGGAGAGELPSGDEEEDEEGGGGGGGEEEEEGDEEENGAGGDGDGDDGEEDEAPGGDGSRTPEEAGDGEDSLSKQQETKQPTEDTESAQQEYAGANYLTDFDWNKIQDVSSEFGQYVTDLCSTETDAESYTVFTREWDQLDPPEIPRGFETKWMEQMEDKIQGMVGPISRQLERAFAARNKSLTQQGQRRGKLSANNLYRLSAEDDRVFKKKIEHKTRDVAVSLVVDCSGSMSGSKIETAMLSAWVMADVLQRLGVICEIMGFTTGDISSTKSQDLYNEMVEENRKGRSWDRVEPLRLPMFKSFDERFGIEQKKRMCSYAHVQGAMWCNVDGESVQYAYESLNRAANKGGKKRGRMMIVFSDGQPAGGGVRGGKLNAHLKKVVKDIEKDGVNIVGVGIMSNAVQEFYRKNVKLDNVADLPGIVLKELRDALLAS